MDWGEYFMRLANVAALRSSCLRRQVGAILVKDNIILSTGFNGTPRGTLNCNEHGCGRCNDKSIVSGERLDECLCIHAEMNAILFSNFKDREGATLYCTHKPCITCLKHLVQAKVHKIVYENDYPTNSIAYDVLASKIILYHDFNVVVVEKSTALKDGHVKVEIAGSANSWRMLDHSVRSNAKYSWCVEMGRGVVLYQTLQEAIDKNKESVMVEDGIVRGVKLHCL